MAAKNAALAPLASEEKLANAHLDELRELMGAEWVESGLRKLMQQIEETFRHASSALADPQALARRAHRLVSHAALFGFTELSELCSQLEEACTSGAELSGIFSKAGAEARVVHNRAGKLV